MCGNGIYTIHATLNTEHLNIPRNKIFAIRPENIKWKKNFGTECNIAMVLPNFPEECVLRWSHIFKV